MLHLTCWVNLLETNVGLTWTQEFLEKPSPTFSSNFQKSKGYGYGCFGANLNHVSQMRHQEWGWEHQNLRTTDQKLPQQTTKCANQHEEIQPNFHGTKLHIFSRQNRQTYHACTIIFTYVYWIGRTADSYLRYIFISSIHVYIKKKTYLIGSNRVYVFHHT